MPTTQLKNLLFLKLGGSLITDKSNPRTARLDVITRLVDEIGTWRISTTDCQIVLGHGSGSFGHMPAQKYGTRQGVQSPDDWHGFAEVWYEAAMLNRIVIDALYTAGLPGISFPVSGGVRAKDGKITAWDLAPLSQALEVNLLPVVYGDVVFDRARGGTILSTEDIFTHLAKQLRPQRILLAGIDDGVWADFPACTQLIPEITPQNWAATKVSVGGSAATDVTGGMQSKVRAMLDLALEIPGLEISVFNGDPPGNLAAALQGQSLGTRISNNNRGDR